MTVLSLDENETAARLQTLATRAKPGTIAPADLADVVLARASRRSRRRHAIVGAGVIAVGAVVAAAAIPGQGSYYKVIEPSGAMQPAVEVGELVVLSKSFSPTRGDIVQAQIGSGDDTFASITRVIGTPGDVVACPEEPSGGCAAVLVNGSALDEPYLAAPTAPFPPAVVPADTVFVLGDNRSDANDSRSFGPIDTDRIIGVAVQIVGADGVPRAVPGAIARPAPDGEQVVDPADPIPGSRTTSGEAD